MNASRWAGVYIVLQDPLRGRVVEPTDQFARRWHDVRTNGTKIDQFGIVIGGGSVDGIPECKATRKPGPCKKPTGPNAKAKRFRPKPETHVIQQVLGAGHDATQAVQGAASRIGNTIWNKLPAPVQQKLGQTWGVAKAIEHKIMIGFRKSKEIALAVAKERGLSTEHIETVGKVLATADLISAWTVNMPATFAATGSATAAKVASWIPVASLGYIAWSTAVNPFAMARAAKALLAGRAHEAIEGQGPENIELLLRRLSENDGDDWYLALLHAAMDETGLGQAIAVAGEAFAGQPEAPEDDDDQLTLDECKPTRKPGVCAKPHLRTPAERLHAASREDPAKGRPSRPEERHPDAKPPALPFNAPPPPSGQGGRKAGGFAATGETNTAFGDRAEAIIEELGLRSILPEGHRQNPLDREWDHSGMAFEVKAVSTKATEYKAKPKASEMEEKRAYAKKHKLKPGMLIAVLDDDKMEVHAYWREGIGAFALNPKTAHEQWNYMGTVSFADKPQLQRKA